MFPDPKRLRIGCSGWSYADWVGPFYPKDAKPGDYLHLYSTIFDAVEIDSTYYRTPSPLMVANWRKITTDGFIFSAKFPKKITHELKLRDSQAQLERFYTYRDNQRHRLSPHGRRPDNHQLQRATERPDTDYEEVVQRPRGEVQPVQTRLHLLQQPLRGIRTWQRQRVPTTSRTSRARLEGYVHRS